VRDGPHRDNRGGGNRGGVAHTAASLRPQARPGLSGSGLYNACIVGRVVLPALVRQRGLRFAPPLRCVGPRVIP
jgi:hypothetical protein